MPFPLVRPCSSEHGFFDSNPPLGLAPELRRGNKTRGTPDKNCLPGLPVIASGGWSARGKER